MHQSFQGWRTNRALPRAGSALQGDCYAFPQHQIYLGPAGFEQTRSGPNWQGGRLTLATCKHASRATRAPLDWIGVWWAGFTPKINGENYLLFLAQVERAFISNYALHEYLEMEHSAVLLAKSAVRNPLGDVFSPRKAMRGEAVYDPRLYIEPKGHVRMEMDKKRGTPKWHNDIGYLSRAGRRAPPLLMGHTYLFSAPKYRVLRPLHRSGWRCRVEQLLTEYLEAV